MSESSAPTCRSSFRAGITTLKEGWSPDASPGEEPRRSGTWMGRAPFGLRQPGVGVDQEAEDAQNQVYEVVDETVAVGEQGEQVGHDEAERADQQVDQAHRQDYPAGDAGVALYSRVEQQGPGGQVDHVLQEIDVNRAEQQQHRAQDRRVRPRHPPTLLTNLLARADLVPAPGLYLQPCRNGLV